MAGPPRAAARRCGYARYVPRGRRLNLIGYSAKPRLLVVGFTERQAGSDSFMRGARRESNGSTMKKAPSRPRKAVRSDDLRRESRLDYSRSRTNRFAPTQTVAVVLEADVAEVFDSSRSVNKFLRSVIAALPGTDQAPRGGRRKAV